MQEGQPVTLQALQDETLTAEDAGAQPLGEGDLDLDAGGGAQEGALLTKESATDGRQVKRDDLAGVGGGEGRVTLLAAVVGERGDEEGLAGEGARQTFEDSAPGGGRHLDAVLQKGHRPDLGAHALARVELDLDQLQIVAVDAVLNRVCHLHPPVSVGRMQSSQGLPARDGEL
jgi:hypothetical protein